MLHCSEILLFALLFIACNYKHTLAIPLQREFKLKNDLIDLDVRNTSEYNWNIIHGQPDMAVGDILSNWTTEFGVFPEELGSYLEGDILFVDEKNQGRNGILGSNYRWPRGIVYYKIAGGFTFGQFNQIRRAMNEFHKHTCIRFVQYTGQQVNHVVIKNERSGCWAAVGRAGGRQYVNLQAPECTTLVGTVIHELMHTVGFWHEQSRLDRDQHVQILWNNVRAENRHNFNKAHSTTFGIPYDYFSVMHYSGSAFSRNGRPTIVPRRPGISLGQRNKLSPKDIAKINAMYNCY